MGNRTDLQTKLETLLGSREVYYNPPETIKMTYPAIVYEKDTVRHTFANDGKYLNHTSYSVTFISRTPDNPIVNKILEMPLTSLDRTFVSDNLYHEVITIYY